MPTFKFEPGQSGNPKVDEGQDTGHLIKKVIAEAMPEIILTLIEQLKLADVQAAKVLLDRCCPVLSHRPCQSIWPVNGSLAEQGGEIIKATM